MDASNTNAARREYINQVLAGLNIKVLFLECIYEDEVDLVESHVRELKMTFPDYEDLTDEDALADFIVQNIITHLLDSLVSDPVL
jgi:hypothetical protein